MIQIVEQTKEEKIAMYMKCNKRALAEMLYQCNLIIEAWTPKQDHEIVTTTTYADYDYRIIKNHGHPNFRKTV